MSDANQSKASILIVDDEPEILRSLKGLLRREFHLFTAETGEEALEIIRRKPIEVILSDQRMPKMTGAELLCEASNVSPESIRIIFTGYADIKAVVDAVNQGSLYRYLVKPWDPDELIETLHEAVEEYRRRHRRRELLPRVETFLEATFAAEGPVRNAATSDTLDAAQELLDDIRKTIAESPAAKLNDDSHTPTP